KLVSLAAFFWPFLPRFVLGCRGLLLCGKEYHVSQVCLLPQGHVVQVFTRRKATEGLRLLFNIAKGAAEDRGLLLHDPESGRKIAPFSGGARDTALVAAFDSARLSIS